MPAANSDNLATVDEQSVSAFVSTVESALWHSISTGKNLAVVDSKYSVCA
jgi:hypothetical protein